jgi:hypothetical protein
LWFHRHQTSQDVDNIIKPILDALKGTVFEDDVQVAQCVVTRIDLTRDYSLSDANIRNDVYEVMLDLIFDPAGDHILYIEVGEQNAQRAVFGPVDGGAS